ncbi:conserved domain-containing protein [Geodermatophilus siccatus]|uniref:Conserved domain-containing protein n=1 Tax=Geodermatophilus siccatus TaxID=1137991 RepID=A0A1G9WKB6_9ACTN|nr:PRC and DUF2382 domain-containing protein [Geodermatophilus siccatus]SDM85032.1 conserved domain-containing protein [Geodermatophilus siccatus]
MLSERELSAAIGSAAYGPDGEKIGTVEHFFTDDRTGAPTWVAISTGLFGTRHSVVPATEATFTGGAVRLPVTKEAVRTAPSVSDQHLDPEAEALLRQHYGLDAGTSPAGTTTAGDAAGTTTAGGTAGTTTAGPAPAGTTTAPAGDDSTTRDLSRVPVDPGAGGPRQDTVGTDRAAAGDATVPVAAVPTPPARDGAMTRSEEQLRVATERYAAKRVRVVKYVVTEEVQVTVPIRREEIRIEEVPLDDGAPATAGALDAVGTGGLPETIVLHTERPVIGTEVVPVERVRLRTEWVQEQQQVRDQVRRERVDVDQDRRDQERTAQDRLGQERIGQERIG